MGKRSKGNKKRAQRRERAKLRADGQLQEPLIDVGEETAEETAEETVEKAVAVPSPAEEHEAVEDFTRLTDELLAHFEGEEPGMPGELLAEVRIALNRVEALMEVEEVPKHPPQGV